MHGTVLLLQQQGSLGFGTPAALVVGHAKSSRLCQTSRPPRCQRPTALRRNILQQQPLTQLRGGACWAQGHSSVGPSKYAQTLLIESALTPDKEVLTYEAQPDGSLAVHRRSNQASQQSVQSVEVKPSTRGTAAHNRNWITNIMSSLVTPVQAAVSTAQTLGTNGYKAASAAFITTFLPVGYPDSVQPEYLRFQAWNILQDISTYLRGILATQAVLEGMGVGRSGSTSLAATLQWMVRDGASMVGGLLFTALASGGFGVQLKSWRLFADIINDVGITLDMLAPLFRRHFLALICLGSVFKAMCGVAAGATNGAITEHWALRNNIADVGAKNGAQHTAVSLLGLGLGWWFARTANRSPLSVWACYVVLTVVHVVANYLAMRTLALRSINPTRMDVICRQALSGEGVPTPAQAAQRERILGLPHRWRKVLMPWGATFKVNTGVSAAGMAVDGDDLRWLVDTYRDQRAMCFPRQASQGVGGHVRLEVDVSLRSDCSHQDQAQAYYQAHVIRQLLEARVCNGQGQGTMGDKAAMRDVTKQSLLLAREHFPSIWLKMTERGWDSGRLMLGIQKWAAQWGDMSQLKPTSKKQ